MAIEHPTATVDNVCRQYGSAIDPPKSHVTSSYKRNPSNPIFSTKSQTSILLLVCPVAIALSPSRAPPPPPPQLRCCHLLPSPQWPVRRRLLLSRPRRPARRRLHPSPRRPVRCHLFLFGGQRHPGDEWRPDLPPPPLAASSDLASARSPLAVDPSPMAGGSSGAAGLGGAPSPTSRQQLKGSRIRPALFLFLYILCSYG